MPLWLTEKLIALVAELTATSSLLYERGWAFGTSGNYSVVAQRDPLRLLITASGRDKRRLIETDLCMVDGDGNLTDDDFLPPSAETLLHCTLARMFEAGAVLHTHSIWNTLLSDVFGDRGELLLRGYEMLKGLAGIATHEAEVTIPIFENTQDIPALAREVRERLGGATPRPHAFLIRGHGLYTWGRDLAEARRHVESLEFLFEVAGRRTQMKSEAV